MADVKILKYERHLKEKIVDSKNIKGTRGTLTVGGNKWPAIERDPSRYVHLAPGTHEGTMEYRPKNGKQCIRFTHPKTDNILMHVANYPHEITGCIAPGTEQWSGGAGYSDTALKAIFTSLGGFSAGTKVKIIVSES